MLVGDTHTRDSQTTIARLYLKDVIGKYHKNVWKCKNKKYLKEVFDSCLFLSMVWTSNHSQPIGNCNRQYIELKSHICRNMDVWFTLNFFKKIYERNKFQTLLFGKLFLGSAIHTKSQKKKKKKKRKNGILLFSVDYDVKRFNHWSR